MLKSMTGFGRCEIVDDDRKIIAEMKSVNHRYCDITIKMPKKLGFFEAAIRTLMKKYVQRGKVDVFITYEDYSQGGCSLKYNQELAADYLKQLRKMSEEFHIDNDIKVSSLSRYPDVLVLEEQSVDENELWQSLETVIRQSCEKLVETRIQEGARLRTDLLAKLGDMLTYVDTIEERSPEIIREYRRKLEGKVHELLGDASIDEGRIAMETTIYADKLCVDEEIVRLKSHIRHMEETLMEDAGIGRKLDFIAQEMNREANTILSKANDLLISNTAIDLKTDIEKVREQIQNIE